MAGHTGTTKILFGSSLAAYYNTDKKKRWVIYQDKDNKNLYEYCVEDDDGTLLPRYPTG